MTPETITAFAALAAAVGAGTLLKELVVWLKKIFSGKAGKQRNEVDRIITEMQRLRKEHREEIDRKNEELQDCRREKRVAEIRYDDVSSKYRVQKEYSSRLRIKLQEARIVPETWPTIDSDTLTKAQVNAIIEREENE